MPNSIFICKRIFGHPSLECVSVSFDLCQCCDGSVDKIVDSFSCTVDIKYVLEAVNVNCKGASSVITGLVNVARSRVVECQSNNCDEG